MPKPRRLALLLLIVSSALGAESSPDFNTAVKLYRERKNPEAKAAFEKLAQAEPQNAEATAYLGRIFIRLGDTESAIKVFDKLVAQYPTHSDYFRELGDAHGLKAQKAGLGFSGLGAARKCKAAYEKAVELDPGNLNARFSVMQFYQQAPGIVGGGLDKAHVQADAIIKLDPVRGRTAKAGVYVAEKKFAEAFALYEAALKEDPADYNSLYAVGRIAAASGRNLERGLEALNKCLAMTPPVNSPGHAAAQWRLGNIREKQGDKTGARAAYEAALKIDPKFAPATDSLKKLK